MRFTIRDLIWLTVVVALATGWFVDRRRLEGVVADWEDRANWLTTSLNGVGWRFEWNNGKPFLVNLKDDAQP